jgi:hypothetical protein
MGILVQDIKIMRVINVVKLVVFDVWVLGWNAKAWSEVNLKFQLIPVQLVA